MNFEVIHYAKMCYHKSTIISEKSMLQLELISNPIISMSMPQLLVATCKMDSQAFKEGVVLLYKHDVSGSQGLMINQPLEANLGTILDQLNIQSDLPGIVDKTIFLGGPLDRSQGLILSMDYQYDKNKIAINTKQQCLEDIAKGKGPKDFLIALGHAAWEPGQLEEEITDGYWIQRSVDPALIFETPAKDRWVAASSQIGFDMRRMTHFTGHG
jgi:putative transcriptional regulator